MLFDDIDDKPQVTLRDYQEEMRDVSLDNVIRLKHRGTLCVAPMAAGKSLTMAATAIKASGTIGGGIAIIAHLRGLVRSNAKAVQQLGRRCYYHYGMNKDVVWGDVKQGGIVSASIQSLSDRAIAKIPPGTIKLLLIDEGHHAVLDSHYARLVKALGNPPVILYSATPDRADGEPLVSDHALCQSVSTNFQVLDFIKRGWILRPYVRYDVATKLDFSVIKNDNNEVTEKECQKIWEAHKSDYAVIKPMLEKHGGMQTVGFAPSVKLAKLWSDLVNDHFEQQGMGKMSEYVASYRPCDYTSAKLEFSSGDRDDIEKAFDECRLRFMFNKGVFLEGANLVAAQLGVLGVVMKSRSGFAQVVGRFLRVCNEDGTDRSILIGMEKATAAQRLAKIAASKKPRAYILDYGGTSGSEKLAHAADLFCYNHNVSEEVRDIARGIIDEQAKKGRDVDVEQAIMDAEEKHKRFLVRDARIRQAIAVQCETVTRDIDPFGGKDVTGAPRYVARKVNPPAPKIVERIQKMTAELGLKYSDQFYRSLTQPKSFAVIKTLQAKVDKQRYGQPCPEWIVTQLRQKGVYETPDNYHHGLKTLNGAKK